MADEAQLMEDAVKTLREISAEYRSEPISQLAAQFSRQLAPRMALDAKPDFEKLQEEQDRTPREFAEEAVRVVAKRGPGYKTPVFKCLEDFEKCKQHSSSVRLCQAALAICIGKHLIPFIGHK
jgi:hypothetical protein